jgi:hypothetical protein
MKRIEARGENREQIHKSLGASYKKQEKGLLTESWSQEPETK